MNVIQRLEDRLFKKKPMADQNAQTAEQATPAQPPVSQAATPTPPAAEPVAPAVGTVDPTPEDTQEEEAAPVEGREAFNCPDCNGEGLKDQYTQCDRCKGTGRI